MIIESDDTATIVLLKYFGIENINRIRLYNPPMEVQKNIVRMLNQKCNTIDSLITEKESLINDLESYKKSLIYEVVTGKRRVV